MSLSGLLAFTTFTALATVADAQSLNVQTVSPARNGMASSNAASIRIGFDAPIQPGSITGRSLQVFGRWSGVVRGTWSIQNAGRDVVFQPARPYFPGERVTVNLSSAIRSTANAPLTGGHAWMFMAPSAPASRNFRNAGTLSVRFPNEPNIQTYGAYCGDLNGDGAPDFSLPNESSNDVRVLLNDGCGSFSPPRAFALPAGAKPSPNEGADFNHDGFVDLAVGNISGNSVTVLLGDGTGAFTPGVTYPGGQEPRGLDVLDVEGDGDMDIVTGETVSSRVGVRLNRGDGVFSTSYSFDGGGGGERGVAAADMNGDGYTDLCVANFVSETLCVLTGNASTLFVVTHTVSTGGWPWGIAAGDVNNDGHVDVVSANFNVARAQVFLGSATGALTRDRAYPVGTHPIAVDLGDLDGDGAADLVVSSYSSSDFTLYWNDGRGGFTSPRTFAAPKAGSCALLVDFDRNGTLDLVGIDEIDDLVLLFAHDGGATGGGLQPASCEATLRIDNRALRAGFGATPPAPLAPGRMFIGLSGPPGRSYYLAIGAPLEPGLATPFGLVNLSAQVIVPGVLDAAGEALIPLAIPALPRGATFAVQAAVESSAPFGFTLTNAEQASTGP